MQNNYNLALLYVHNEFPPGAEPLTYWWISFYLFAREEEVGREAKQKVGKVEKEQKLEENIKMLLIKYNNLLIQTVMVSLDTTLNSASAYMMD